MRSSKIFLKVLDFVCFLRVGDQFLPDAMARLRFAMTANPTARFHYSDEEIIDLETNSVNGKSTRIIARKLGTSAVHPPNNEALDNRAAREQGLDSLSFYDKWFEGLERNKLNIVRFIKHAVSEGKKVWVYGASTKGNVILQYYGLDHRYITAAADRSPEKWGLRTVGTNIPIVSEDEFRKASPDYALILPYAFEKEMVQRESEWLNSGGTFIVPLPEAKLITKPIEKPNTIREVVL